MKKAGSPDGPLAWVFVVRRSEPRTGFVEGAAAGTGRRPSCAGCTGAVRDVGQSLVMYITESLESPLAQLARRRFLESAVQSARLHQQRHIPGSIAPGKSIGRQPPMVPNPPAVPGRISRVT